MTLEMNQLSFLSLCDIFSLLETFIIKIVIVGGKNETIKPISIVMQSTEHTKANFP